MQDDNGLYGPVWPEEDLPHCSYPKGGLSREQEDTIEELPYRCADLEESVKKLEEAVKKLESRLEEFSRASMKGYMALWQFIGLPKNFTEEEHKKVMERLSQIRMLLSSAKRLPETEIHRILTDTGEKSHESVDWWNGNTKESSK